MPQPILCLDEEVCHFAERFRTVFSKPQYQYERFRTAGADGVRREAHALGSAEQGG